MKIIICTVPTYQFKGWFFEYKPHLGPWPLKKDGEPRKRAGMKFYTAFQEWFELPDLEKKKHKVDGGCICL